MNADLEKALQFANYRKTVSMQMKILKEKIDARLTYGHNGGLFKIDRSLLAFVQMIIDQDRLHGVALLDSNEVPVIIQDMTVFRDEIMDRYFSAVLEYSEKYQQLKKSRSVETLVQL